MNKSEIIVVLCRLKNRIPIKSNTLQSEKWVYGCMDLNPRPSSRLVPDASISDEGSDVQSEYGNFDQEDEAQHVALLVRWNSWGRRRAM